MSQWPSGSPCRLAGPVPGHSEEAQGQNTTPISMYVLYRALPGHSSGITDSHSTHFVICEVHAQTVPASVAEPTAASDGVVAAPSLPPPRSTTGLLDDKANEEIPDSWLPPSPPEDSFFARTFCDVCLRVGIVCY